MNENYNVSSSPHIRDRVTSSTIMLMVVIALLPATFFGIWNFRREGAWLLILVTVASAVLAEHIWEQLMHMLHLKTVSVNMGKEINLVHH